MAKYWANATFTCNGTPYTKGQLMKPEDVAAIGSVDGFVESGWVVTDDVASLLPAAALANSANLQHVELEQPEEHKPVKKAVAKKTAATK